MTYDDIAPGWRNTVRNHGYGKGNMFAYRDGGLVVVGSPDESLWVATRLTCEKCGGWSRKSCVVCDKRKAV